MSLSCKTKCVLSTSGECSLADAGCSQTVCIAAHADGEHTVRLRELGFAEGRLVRIIAGVDPLICSVGRARIALARSLAHSILVRPVHA